MGTDRPDWQDGASVETETETAVLPRDGAGRVVRPNWNDEFSAPAEDAPAAESPAADPVAGVPDTQEERGKLVRPDWTGEEDAEADAQPAPENAMHPDDVVPPSIFASPEDVGDEVAPALDVAKSILSEDAGWKNTIDGFTRNLTVAAQDVIVAEMAASAFDIDAPPLTDAQAEAFKSLPEGDEIWSEWGDSAPEKAAIVRARLDRLILNLPEHEVGEFDGLLDALPPAAYREVLRQLAG